MTIGRVLIVDDSLTVRMDLDEAFRSAGLETQLAADVAAARQSIANARPDLIVLDVLLPDVDGVELLTELRLDPATEKIPVVLLSSEAEVEHRIRGLKTGADDYVGKPYELSYLIARSKELLRRESPTGCEGPTILLIEDSLTYREELAETLRGAGYRVEGVGSAEDGLQAAALSAPDAIIVDGILPGMDGPTLIRKVRLDRALAAIPCLLLTASEGPASELAAFESGADAYARKGDGTDIVLARLAAILRSATQSRQRLGTTSLLGAKRILAVDDSRTFLEEVAEHLRSDGFDVVKARSGEEALQLLAVEQVDAVLLDLMMPGMSGTDVCRVIKESPSTRTVPVIMLTAKDDPEDMIAGMNAGADDYVIKSADFEVIRARLRAQLRRKQFEDENRKVRQEILKREEEALEAREQALKNAQARHEAQIALGQSEAYNRALLEAIPDVIVRIDAFGKILDVIASEQSDAFVRLDDLGKSLGDILSQEDATGAAENIAAVIAGGAFQIAEWTVTSAKGKRNIEARYALCGEGEVVIIARDVTEKKRTARSLEQHVEALRLSNAALASFTYAASHDLLTPLSNISLLAGRVHEELGDALPEKAGKHLDRIQTRVRCMSELLEGIRVYVQAGQVVEECQEVDLREILQEISQSIELPEAFSIEMPPQAFPLNLPRTSLRTVMRSLLENSIKHHDRAEGHVRILLQDREDAVEIVVRDDGPGIPAEFHERVFQPFETLKTRDEVEGSGMGLPLSKRIVESHRGKLWLESDGPRGATFRFTWPKPS